MKIVVLTETPTKLLNAMKKAAKEVQGESMRTWSIVTDTEKTEMFIHSTQSQQWENVLLKPEIDPKISLIFKTVQWTGKPTTKDQRSYVTGRFVEQLLANFDDLYTNLEIYP